MICSYQTNHCFILIKIALYFILIFFYFLNKIALHFNELTLLQFTSTVIDSFNFRSPKTEILFEIYIKQIVAIYLVANDANCN